MTIPIGQDYIDLGGIIAALEAEDPTRVLPLGFHDPHSYRGYYEQLAFAPARNITIGEMLAAAKSAVGTTFEGWKGGEYVMSEDTDCWIANQGDTSDNKIGPMLLRLLLSQGSQDLVELEPPKPALPAEPARLGTAARVTAPHAVTEYYERHEAGWYLIGRGGTPLTWVDLHRLGEVAVLVPAPDLAELVEALRETAPAWHDRECGDYDGAPSYYRCSRAECVEWRALLARYETGAAA